MRVGIVGLDSFFFAQMFTTHLSNIADVELVGCATLGVNEAEIKRNNGLNVQEFAAMFNTPVYREPEQLLEEQKVDAVCITTRPSKMPGILKTMVTNGIHVFVAKPVAVNEAGLRILESIEANQTIVSAGPTIRFDPAFREAYDKVSRGDIGQVTAIRMMHQHGMLRFWPEYCWYHDRQEGGIEHFLAWYCIDLLRWMSRQEITDIHAVAANTVDRTSPHADVLKAVCKLSNGAPGSFDVLFNVSWSYPMFEVEVIGESGAVRVQQDAHDGNLFNQDGQHSFGRAAYDSLGDELAHWVKACQGEAQISMNLHDIAQTVKYSLQIHQALAG